MRSMTIKNQIKDVETNRVIKYLVGDAFHTFELSKEKVYDLAKSGDLTNCYLYKDKLLVFTKPFDVSDADFLLWNYSSNLKSKLQSMYSYWKAGGEREIALNLENDVDFTIKEDNGLYKLVDININKKIDVLEIPSFVTSIIDDADYFKHKIVSFSNTSLADYLENANIYVNKYTDGLYYEMLIDNRNLLNLNGLITIISYSDVYVQKAHLTPADGITSVSVLGRTKWVKEDGLNGFESSLNLNLGKHVRVCYVPSTTKNLNCYDTTLLLNSGQISNPTILQNKNENRDILLDFKSYISNILDGYNAVNMQKMNDNVIVTFGNHESLSNFISDLHLKYYVTSDLVITFKVMDLTNKYKNSDTLFWGLQFMIKDKIESLLFQYSFATAI